MNINNIMKLLQISSLNFDLIGQSYRNDKELIESIQNNHGFYAFESALHFFSKNEAELLNSFIEKNSLYYDAINNCNFIAEDLFGNLFCKTMDNKYYLLDLETGDLEYIGNSFDSWAKNILEDYNYFTGYSIGHNWQKKYGMIEDQHRLIPIKPFVLGGEYSDENLMLIEQKKGLLSRHSLYQQIKDIPDNNKVIIDKIG